MKTFKNGQPVQSKKSARNAKPISSAAKQAGQQQHLGEASLQSPQPRPNQTGQTSSKQQKSIVFKKSAESQKQKGVMKSQQMTASTLKGGMQETTRQDTTVMNQSTENSQANSWQKQIKKQEETKTSWFDWFTCGQCTLQPELNEETMLRKSAAESGRAPKMMHIQIDNKDHLLDMDNSSNDLHVSQTTSGVFLQRGTGLAPRRTFDEFNNIIFDDEPPSGIKPTAKNTISGDENAEKNLIQNMTRGAGEQKHRQDQHLPVDMSDSNLMLDIDEAGTPQSERTQLLYTGREHVTQQQQQTTTTTYSQNPQEDVGSLSRTNGQGVNAFNSQKKMATVGNTGAGHAHAQLLSPKNVVGSGSKQRDTSPSSYKQDYQKEIIRSKKDEARPKGSIATNFDHHEQNGVQTNKATAAQLNDAAGKKKDGLDFHNDSTISSNDSIPEEMMEENSPTTQHQTSAAYISPTQFPERSATAMAQPQTKFLSFNKQQNTAQTQNEKEHTAQELTDTIQKTTYVSYSKEEAKQISASRASQHNSESALIAEEHSVTATAHEEESSCHHFRRLEQQIQAEDKQFNNVDSSRETQEVAVVSISNMPTTEHNHPGGKDEDDDEFLRVERACLAYDAQITQQEENQQPNAHHSRQPSSKQPTEHQQMFSTTSTPVCPTKNGPRATSALKRNQFLNNRGEPQGNDHLLQEQIHEQSQQTLRDTSGIEFQINKFDSLNRTDHELLEGDTGRKFSATENMVERHNHTSSGKRQGCNDSSDSGLINIQSAQLAAQPFVMVQPEEIQYRKKELNFDSQEDSSILPHSIAKQALPVSPAPQQQEQKRLKPPVKTKVVPGLTPSMRRSPEAQKEKTNFYSSKDPKKLTFGKQGISRQSSQQTFGGSSPRGKNVVGARNKISTLQQRSSLQSYNQKRPTATTSKVQGNGKKNHLQKPSASSKHTEANVTGTDGNKSLEVHQTAMHATNTVQLQTQQQGHNHNEESSQTHSSLQVTATRQKSATINSFDGKPMVGKQRTQSVYKPNGQQQRSNLGVGLGLGKRRSVSGMKKDGLGKRNKVAEIFEKYANVTTIDLTVRPRAGKSENRKITIADLGEETKRESMAGALRELNKSIRSNSHVSFIERQRSSSRKSVHREPSFAGSQVQPHKQASFQIKNGQSDRDSSAGRFGTLLQVDNRSPPFTHERTRESKAKLAGGVREGEQQYSMTASQISSIQHDNKQTPPSQGRAIARKHSSSLHMKRQPSRSARVDYIYKQYQTQEPSSGPDQLKKAVRQLRKSFHSQSSRGKARKEESALVQTNPDRPQTNTDIYSQSSQMLNTDRVSRTAAQQVHPDDPQGDSSGRIFKDRVQRTKTLEKAPLPRLQKRNRSPPEINSSQVSNQTAMFGNMKMSETQQRLAQTQRDHSRKELPPIPKMASHQADMTSGSNLKEHLVEAAKDQNTHLLLRQESKRQHNLEFKAFRNSHKVNTDIIPNADEIQKFKQFTEAEKHRLSESKMQSQSMRKMGNASPRNRSNSNLNITAESPRSRTRQGMNGFFESRRSSAGNRRSLTKKEPITPASKQQSGGNQAMFQRRAAPSLPKYKAAMSRSMSPSGLLSKRQKPVRQSSKRSMSVLHEHSKERDKMASTSPVRLSKIMSQKEISTAKKFKIDMRRDSRPSIKNREIFQINALSSVRSKSSRRDLHNSNQKGHFQVAKNETGVKARLKPLIPRFSRPTIDPPTITNKRISIVGKTRPTANPQVVSIGVGAIKMPGIAMRTSRAMNGQTMDEGLKNMNNSSTRQLRSGKALGTTATNATTGPGGRAGQAKNSKVALGQKLTNTAGGPVTARKSRQMASAQQFQSSFNNNNNKLGSEAKNIKSAPRWN